MEKLKFMINIRVKVKLIVLLSLALVIVPNLFVTNQGEKQFYFEDKKIPEIIIQKPSIASSVYYEDTTGFAHNVYVSGNYAYVGDEVSGLAVIDISDPTNPGTPIYEATNSTAYGVYVSGDNVYVGDGSAGLAVIDISDPTNPGAPVYESTGGTAQGIYVSGDYAYMGVESSGLVVIDISDPTNPGSPVYVATTGISHGVYVSGDYAYVGVGNSGLAIIDISDPTSPGAPVYEDTAGLAYDVYVSGDYAYVGDGSTGLAIIDVSDPTNPGTPIYKDTTGSAHGVYVSGFYAYVGDYDSGLAVIDISDPTNPGMPYYEDTNGFAHGVYVSGGYAYVGDGDSGLAVIEISIPIDPGTPIYEEIPFLISFMLAAIFIFISIALANIIRHRPKWRGLKDISFTTAYPRVIKPGKEYSLSVFPQLPKFKNDIQQIIKTKEKQEDFNSYFPTVEPILELKCATELKFIPLVEGITFDPVKQDVPWYRDIKEVTFRIITDSKNLGNLLGGAIDIYKDSLFIGQIPLSIKVSQEEKPTEIVNVNNKMFERLFISYSHTDQTLIDNFIIAYKSLGIKVKIDKDALSAGDTWWEKLKELIEKSDVFQLYWSNKAKESENVTNEWKHALKILEHGEKAKNFIRPCYWEDPMPIPPEDLKKIHFYKINIEKLDFRRKIKKKIKKGTSNK